MNTRYTRQIQLPEIGHQGQEKLTGSHVLVIGAGGLGCPVLQYLATAGVGSITIIDGDVISLENLNRQTLYSESEVGQKKADIAEEKVSAMNPRISVMAISSYLNYENAHDLIPKADVVVDCTDNIPSRYLLSDFTAFYDKPLVFAGIHRFEGQIALFNGRNKTTYRDLFPYDPNKVAPASCNENGVLGPVAGLIGMFQAMEVVKYLLGIGESLDGKLMIYDTLTNSSKVFAIKPTETTNKPELGERPEYGHLCRRKALLEAHKLLTWNTLDYDLIDIREATELPNCPLTTTKEVRETSDKIVLICQTGKRSELALGKWRSEYPHKSVYSLNGGVLELIREMNRVMSLNVKEKM